MVVCGNWILPDGMSAQRKQVQTLLADDFKKYDENKLSDLLKHADMRIRQKSQLELATRGEKGSGSI